MAHVTTLYVACWGQSPACEISPSESLEQAIAGLRQRQVAGYVTYQGERLADVAADGVVTYRLRGVARAAHPVTPAVGTPRG